MKTKGFLKALFVSAIVVTAASAHAEEKTWTKITIATEGAFRPYNFTKPDGTLDGYEIELSKDLCARMKVECTMIAQPFDGIIPALNAGKFDAIMAGLTATAKREETIDFSVSYGLTPQTFATLKDSPFAKLPHTGETLYLAKDEAAAQKAIDDVAAEIKGRTIGVQTASLGLTLLEKYFKDSTDIREYKTTDQHDLDLKSGRVDLVVASLAYLSDTVKKPGNEDIVMTGPFFKGGILGRGVAVGLRKGEPELQKMFNEAIDAAKADGTVKRLSEKWFGFDVTP
ncbi:MULTISPECIES: transporter substrate-binding domain-containing protein [unclassified Agrobacterium]|jgi:octopine/nopaline transport system substrate-binding protein|uniref:transporter substrate-binding domain-containing protein n=1 Tax=unclassified Agrobacterium TaxID=2632611 RepID=UPI0017850376|nr:MULTISPECIES: transporter substrate-binding domain-containing protein [unclassified Agrobacterium]MBD9389315.1 transporter substrate-binding domain-containing protein [Agrobacterium sp. AGB01]MDO5898486.1 transporter substrate-binding domain-containing protein [Agrobacterium sp. Azo12]